jgi:MFS family permease
LGGGDVQGVNRSRRSSTTALSIRPAAAAALLSGDPRQETKMDANVGVDSDAILSDVGGDEGTTATAAAGSSSCACCSVRLVCGGTIAGLAFGISVSFGLFVTPITSDLGIRREVISLAVGCSMLVNGRHGIFVTVLLGALLTAAGLGATSIGRDAWVFCLTIPFTGFAEASASPGVILGAVGRLYDDEHVRSRAMGASSALQSCGAVMVPPLIGLALELVGHWSTAFRIVAGVALL